MSTVLTNGIIIPDNGNRNWGGDLANNWNIIDLNVGYMTDVKNRVTTLENSVAENTANIQNNASNISALQTSKQDKLNDQQIANIADVTNKANDADVVHKSGDETISGVKTFSKISLKSSRIERGALPASNITEDSEIEIVDKNNRRILGIFNYYYTTGSGRTSLYTYNPNTTDYDNLSIAFDFDNTNNRKSLIPVSNNIDLGTSKNKWKTLNGINPGALSLPRGADKIEISIAQGQSTYTPPFDGWLQVQTSTQNFLLSNGLGMTSRFFFSPMGDLVHKDFGAYVPCRKGIVCDIYVDAATIGYFIPCQGNV